MMLPTELISAFAEGLQPHPDVYMDQWADADRKLTSETSSEIGDWHTSRTPHLREIMRELSPQSDTEEVVFVGGSQIGKSEVGNNFIGYTICVDPGPGLYLHSTLDTADDASVGRIDTMIAASPALRKRLYGMGAKKNASTRRRKMFPGGVWYLRGSKSAQGLRSLPVRYMLVEEADSFPRDVQGEGDPISLAVRRTATFFRRKILYVSTTTIKGRSHIWNLFEKSDQRHYHLPCPMCGHAQWLQWKGFIWRKDEAGQHLPETVKYQCEMCGDLIGEEYKEWMLANGEWVPDNPGHPVRGYHLSGFYAPVGLGLSWAQIVRDKLDCGSDPVKLKTWTNHVEARPWEEHAEEVDKSPLLERLEDFRGAQVPAGGLVVVVGIDLQEDRFEVVVRAFGAGEESWLLEWKTIEGGIKDRSAKDELAEYLVQKWKHESGVDLPLAMALIDSGNQAKFVYDLVRSLRAKGIRISASKGSSHYLPEAIKKQKPKGGVPFFSIGTEFCKVAIYGRLNDTIEPGPGFYHFPAGTSDEYFEQLTSEKFSTKLYKGQETTVWERKAGVRNEVLDCEVLCLACVTQLKPNYKKIAARMPKGPERQAPATVTPAPAYVDPRSQQAPGKVPTKQRGRGSFVNRWRS